MSRLRLALFVLALVPATAAISPPAASAYDWPAYGFLGSTGFGASGSLYGLGYVPVPPYYALHPPVYYSQPVPRTYGYSPFPYPGTYRTPEIVAPEPQVIVNPYANEAPADAAPTPPLSAPANEIKAKVAGEEASAVLLISNPFASQNSERGTRNTGLADF